MAAFGIGLVLLPCGIFVRVAGTWLPRELRDIARPLGMALSIIASLVAGRHDGEEQPLDEDSPPSSSGESAAAEGSDISQSETTVS